MSNERDELARELTRAAYGDEAAVGNYELASGPLQAAIDRIIETRSAIMTPTEAERLRDLFYEAKKAARRAEMLGTSDAYRADDAATAAFNTALREYTKEGV